MGPVRVSAKADYAVRAMIELAGATEERPVAGEQIAGAQEIPLRFLEPILTELRYAGLVRAAPGRTAATGSPGPPDELTLAEIISELEAPWRASVASRPRSSPSPATRSRCGRSGSRWAPTCDRSSTR